MLSVKSVVHPNLIVVSVDDGPEIVVTDRQQKWILPNVGIQSGVGRTGGNNRLCFDAPKSIRISRLELEK